MSIEVEILERGPGKITLKGGARLLFRRFHVKVACEGDEELVKVVEEAARLRSLEVLETLRSRLAAVKREPRQLRIRLAGGECVVSGDARALELLYDFLRGLLEEKPG
ncbi:MAG: hypothetical protein QXI90_02495 [Thermofilum sp.]